jgi:hypothetical protein
MKIIKIFFFLILSSQFNKDLREKNWYLKLLKYKITMSKKEFPSFHKFFLVIYFGGSEFSPNQILKEFLNPYQCPISSGYYREKYFEEKRQQALILPGEMAYQRT